MRCSVVIPCWIVNQELYQLTHETLQSLQGDIELVIVDNASPIGGDSMQKVADICIRNKENLGFPAAVNQGIQLSHGQLICISNNDIRVSPNWLDVAEEIFKENPSVGTVHFKMVDYNAPFALSDGVWITGKEKWCHGSFFVIRREVVESVGLYDENYGMGGFDDWDYFKRIRDKGWMTAYTNKAAYQHKDSTTQNLRDPAERSESDKANVERFIKKFGEEPDVMFYKKYPEQKDVPWKPFP